MGRRLVFLLMLTAGCSLPPLPKTVYIDSRFSPEEYDAIRLDLDQTNQELGMDLLGYPILEYGGRYDDPDGFNIDGSDLGDGVHVIYKEAPGTQLYWELLHIMHYEDLGGYATVQDVVLFDNLDDVPAIEQRIAEIESDPNWQNDKALKQEHQGLVGLEKYRRSDFHRVTLHELGHHLGMLHDPDPTTVMWGGYDLKADDWQPQDKASFCLIQGCSYP